MRTRSYTRFRKAILAEQQVVCRWRQQARTRPHADLGIALVDYLGGFAEGTLVLVDLL
ncbi:hypothetical protein ACFIOY_19450 [Bradyrhizobium sp. TZ2]